MQEPAGDSNDPIAAARAESDASVLAGGAAEAAGADPSVDAPLDAPTQGSTAEKPRARKRKKGSADRSKESGKTKRKKNCEGFGSIARKECWH